MTIAGFFGFTMKILNNCFAMAPLPAGHLLKKNPSEHEIFWNYVLQTINFSRSETIQEEVEYGLGIGA